MGMPLVPTSFPTDVGVRQGQMLFIFLKSLSRLINWVTGSFRSQQKPGYQFSPLLLEVVFPPAPASCPARMRSSYLVLITPSGFLLKPLQTSISSPFSHVCEFFLYELESSSNLQPASVILLSRALCWRKQKCLKAELGEINQDTGWSGLLTTSSVSTVKLLQVVGLQGVQSKGAGRGLYWLTSAFNCPFIVHKIMFN